MNEPTTITKTDNKDVIASLQKAAALLMLFEKENNQELSIQEISRLLGVPKTTAHRLASTLLLEDMLEQDEESKKYRLGLATYVLGNRYMESHTLERVSQAHIAKIVRELGESVGVSVRDGFQSVLIDKMDGVHAIRVINQIGVRNPLHCSGSGKVFLGYMPPEERREFIQKLLPLKSYTPYTIVDAEKLFDDVADVASCGYAYECEEIRMDLICISAPLFDRYGNVCAAVTISGPKTRIAEKGVETIGNRLREICIQMSQEMGYRPE